MDRNQIISLSANFENACQFESSIQFWYARDIQKLLEYAEWRNFLQVIEKAKESCRNAENLSEDHFVDVNKMVEIGSGTTREIEDIKLTRYACYLIAQNGDPRKTVVAFAQNYFAVQTRKQEILEERIRSFERIEAKAKLSSAEKQLSTTLFEHGVDQKGFGIVRSEGDKALFGGLTTFDVKKKLGIQKSKPLADFLPTVVLKAKEFATAITDYNVRKDRLIGVSKISSEHKKNNEGVRDVLLKRNIQPENLPAEEDIKMVERRFGKDGKILPKEALPKEENNG